MFKLRLLYFRIVGRKACSTESRYIITETWGAAQVSRSACSVALQVVADRKDAFLR